ncbi:cytochrome c biogenesis ATP-binding export protein CcmA [Tsuneonella deserti]|uniref:Cytochrome c biogenesis ATP-binding export protein CcmA n=1 Tax=Tsuneonella deserti TaxID=2035528 RepID=A0ABQ1SAR3_9SPHN|nr:heme ABC exporter ATP-binding protein CcmA [Tsuneonella deserti]GGD98462.1 cytochrome c biogenesis ATP-binding export protein CcmA [Tsuneonella deserti]
MTPRLTVQDLACRRGDRLLFRGLSFSLEPGAALHVRGANGTGKSSLLRILAGLLRPFAGTVEAKGRIALLGGELPLDEHLPLEKALAFWNAIDGGGFGPERLATLGLEGLRDVPVRFLSTGQRKRAAYAVSIPAGTPIWLLDEPLNGLDGHAAGVLTDEIERHRDAGGIVVAASHQPLPLGKLHAVELADYAA